MMKPALAAIAALLLSVAASAQTGSWSRLEGQHSKIAQRRAMAVNDATEWAKVWKEHDASAPVPAVDFAKESVVAVFLGETPNTGVKIEIVVQKDMIDVTRLNVFYKEVRSASKSFSAAMICQPYAIVKVPKAAVVSIEADGKVLSPENPQPVMNPRNESKVRALLETPSFDGR